MTDTDRTPNAIKVTGVSKTFKLPHEKTSSIKNIFTHVIGYIRKRRSYEEQKALNNISFEIKEGEFFGIVGRNGSGKSTLLKLIAGIYKPDEGTIEINGRLTPFIELGVGFNMELTGRENVFLNGALLGFSRNEMLDMYDSIVEFAELDRFMDQKLKNYSSGMQVRLAFSIAIRAQSEILLIDEVLAVGDAIFQKKCLNYFKELKKNRRTVVLVSHDASILEEFCERGILIEKSTLIKEGPIKDVVNDYIDILNEREEQLSKKDQNQPGGRNRWGTGSIRVTETQAFEIVTSKDKRVFTEEDKAIGVRVSYTASEDCEEPVYGITISDPTGIRIFQSNTLWSEIKTKTIKKGQSLEIIWQVPNVFNTGDFSVSPAAANRNGSEIYDWQDDAVKFKVRKKLRTSGYANIEHTIIINDR